jgi:3-oxoacyl-[acyl-carrier-protein] synthase-1/3-oxoacyl-[acyl-carrier-protein] synthase II
MKAQPLIPVTGIGCICAPGRNLAECMQGLYAGSPPPAPPRSLPDAQHPVFQVPDHFLPPLDGDGPTVRAVRLARVAVDQALLESGWSPAALRGLRVGVVVGTNVASGVSNRALRCELDMECSGLSPAERYRMVNPARWIAQRFGLSGPHLTIVNACSAGSDALGLAATWIRAGRCDVVLAGGTDAFYEVTYYGFIALLNSDTVACRPFDRDRNGLNLGEGAAMMVLESEAAARARRARARAFLAGYGTAADAHHLTAPHPEGLGLQVAIDHALGSAGLSPADIAFINAHGTGTRENDRVESLLFHRVFPGVPFGSTKGATGHTLGAAGAIEAAFTIAALERGLVPASRGFAQHDPELPAQPLADNTPVSGRAALSQTLAFGGNNSVLVFTRGGDV